MPVSNFDDRLDALLDQVLALPSAQRAAHLASSCAGDPALHQRLKHLLELAQREDGFLDRSPLMAIEPAADRNDDAESAPARGQRLGAFELVQPIGSGGMGEVWLAERVDGSFRQQVAIKRMRPELGASLLRFTAEREILAGLEHPGIARLYDGGVDDQGRPYMVMEYVEGEHLLDWCLSHEAGLEQRLDLFLQVCDAVAYAQSHLVVHRDLKPTNILVTGDGRVKLLDFGIAKLLQEPALDMATRTVHLSPAYAAPEQLSGGRIGTATDVHALGVLLYELLAARIPWQVGDLPLATAVQRLLDTTPIPPSRALSADATIARRSVRGDLDAIVAKALRKEPSARYPDARAMADDIRRHLRREPIQARSGARSYVARRFVRRHWLPLSAAATVFAALLAGLVGIAWQARQTEQQASRAVAVQQFMASLFADAGPSARLGPDASARDVLAAGMTRLQQDPVLNPQVRGELLIIIGESLHALSLVHDARQAFDLAGEQQALYPAEFSEQARLRLLQSRNAQLRGEAEQAGALADALLDELRAHGMRGAIEFRVHVVRADLRLQARQFDAAVEALQPAVELLSDASNMIEAEDEAAAMLIWGIGHSKLREPETAVASIERALALYRELDPEHPALGSATTMLATVYQDQALYPRAMALHEQAIEQIRRVFGADSIELGHARNNYAGLLLRAGEHATAIEQLQEVVLIHERLAIEDRASTGFSRYLLALALTDARRDDEARQQLDKALAMISERGDPTIVARIGYMQAVLDCRQQPVQGLPALEALLPSLDQDSRSWYMRGRIYYADCLEAARMPTQAHAEYAAVERLVHEHRQHISPADHIHVELREGLARTHSE